MLARFTITTLPEMLRADQTSASSDNMFTACLKEIPAATV